MPYVIGVKMQEYDGSVSEGLYSFSDYGTKGICTLENKNDGNKRVLVFEDLKEAEDYVKFLSKNYRYEFGRRIINGKVVRKKVEFYLLKTNTPKFKFKFKKKGSRSIAYETAYFYYLE